jgi:hypothetical protein
MKQAGCGRIVATSRSFKDPFISVPARDFASPPEGTRSASASSRPHTTGKSGLNGNAFAASPKCEEVALPSEKRVGIAHRIQPTGVKGHLRAHNACSSR